MNSHRLPFYLLLFLLTAGAALAAAEIRVQGRQTGIWNTISDGDSTPDQQVTDFDTVDFGDSKLRLYRIQNRGDQNLTVSALTTNGSEFTFVGISLPVMITPGSDVQFEIRYTPTGPSRTANINVVSNAPGAGAIYNFAVTGMGEGPEIQLAGRQNSASSWTNIADGTTTTSAGQGTDFGNVSIGSSVTREFRITNSGNAKLRINNRSFSGNAGPDFDVSGLFAGSPINGSVLAGSQRIFSVTWTPTSAGAKSTTFSIGTNDHDESPYEFVLTGNAIADPDVRIQGRASGFWNAIDDGDLVPNQAVTDFGSTGSDEVTRKYRIQNQGAGTLTVTSINSSHSDFAISANFPMQVAAGADKEFDITFVPSRLGTVQSTITALSNDPDAESTYTFGITASSRGSELTVQGRRDAAFPFINIQDGDTTPSESDGTDFGDSPMSSGGTLDSRLLRITNTGDSALRVNDVQITGDSDSFNIFVPKNTDPFRSIAPGEHIEFYLNFGADSAGERNAGLRILSNDPFQPIYEFDIRGNAIDVAKLSVSGGSGAQSRVAAAILEQFGGFFIDVFDWKVIENGDNSPTDGDGTDFDNRDVNSGSNSNRFRISSGGSLPLDISSISTNSEQFSIEDLPTSPIPGDEHHIFRVNFAPTAPGRHDAIVRIQSNAGVFAFHVTGFGRGEGSPQIVVEGRDGALAWTAIVNGGSSRGSTGTKFGTATAGTAGETHQFRITNPGSKTLVLGAPEQGTNFVITDFPTELEPGARKIFDITFAPQTAGEITLPLLLANNSEDAAAFTLNLTGVAEAAAPGAAPEIAVGGAGEDIASGSTDPNPADGTDFGTGLIGSQVARQFTVHNDGTLPLDLSSVTSSQPLFNITEAPTSVAAGESGLLIVTFSPVSTNPTGATISIANNDPDGGESPFTFAVSGRGNSVVPSIAVNTADSSFATTEIGDRLTKIFTIENNGDAALVLSGISVDSPEFQVQDLSSELAPDGQQTIAITFRPTVAGDHLATVTIYSNDPVNNPFQFSIAGTGVIDEGPALTITEFTMGSTEVQVRYQSQEDETYRIVWSPDATFWIPVPGHEGINGTGGENSRTIELDTLPDVPRQFFRVEEEN